MADEFKRDVITSRVISPPNYITRAVIITVFVLFETALVIVAYKAGKQSLRSGSDMLTPVPECKLLSKI